MADGSRLDLARETRRPQAYGAFLAAVELSFEWAAASLQKWTEISPVPRQLVHARLFYIRLDQSNRRNSQDPRQGLKIWHSHSRSHELGTSQPKRHSTAIQRLQQLRLPRVATVGTRRAHHRSVRLEK